ncbi:MAG TPA: type 1 glutamine amidotransferase domain-containing protein [Salinimicrobium sp.]|nr:type 1 glutamine amidotransferase domain-containing protein [Salinimicrobium sp.]
MKILMVLTSHDSLGETGKKTGVWLDEFTAPYYVFKNSGAEITLATPKGGEVPVDPASEKKEVSTEETRRFESDQEAQDKLRKTIPLEKVEASGFDAVFYPGGHGPLWDLAIDLKSIALIEDFIAQMKPMAFVCHAPGVLGNVEEDKEPYVRGKNVTGFSNSEEQEAGLDQVVPFLVEDKMNQMGANYSKGSDGSQYVMVDGRLITGQNPASAKKAAMELIKMVS